MKLRELNPILDDHAYILVAVDENDKKQTYELHCSDKVEFFETNGDYTVDFITYDKRHEYDFIIYVSKEVR